MYTEVYGRTDQSLLCCRLIVSGRAIINLPWPHCNSLTALPSVLLAFTISPRLNARPAALGLMLTVFKLECELKCPCECDPELYSIVGMGSSELCVHDRPNRSQNYMEGMLLYDWNSFR